MKRSVSDAEFDVDSENDNVNDEELIVKAKYNFDYAGIDIYDRFFKPVTNLTLKKKLKCYMFA